LILKSRGGGSKGPAGMFEPIPTRLGSSGLAEWKGPRWPEAGRSVEDDQGTLEKKSDVRA